MYPGALSLQAISFTAPPSGGLYFAADDTLAFRKTFAVWGEPDGSAGYDMVHLPSDPGASDVYAPQYAAIVGAVQEDWFSAAERYRAWGTRQYWARTSRLATRTTPSWIRETGIWVWNRGRSSDVLEPGFPAAAGCRPAGQRLLALVARRSLRHVLPRLPAAARRRGILYRRRAEGARRGRARHRVHEPAALVHEHAELDAGERRTLGRARARRQRATRKSYNVFDPLPCATMDISTEFWRDKYAGIADTVMHQYGLDGIYMDQAVLSLACWSRRTTGIRWEAGTTGWTASALLARGPPPPRDGALPVGFGRRRRRRELAARPRRVSHAAGEPGALRRPGSGWEPIPFFQAVYHPYAVTYGTYGSLTLPPYDDLWPAASRPANALTLLDRKYRRQYFLEQARMFVWGMQPTIANFLPEQLSQRRAEVDYLERLARLRYGLRESS